MADSTDKGGRKPRVTDADLLDVFRGASDPVLSTAEVADAVPIQRRGTLNRLRALEAEGALDSKQIGGRNTVWWLAGTGATAEERREPATDAARSDTGDESGEDLDAPARSRGGESDDALDDALAGWEPDNVDTETARAQTRRAAEWLRSTGKRHIQSDFVDALADDSTLGSRSWWERAVQPGLMKLRNAGLVEYRSGHHDYRWVGEGEA